MFIFFDLLRTALSEIQAVEVFKNFTLKIDLNNSDQCLTLLMYRQKVAFLIFHTALLPLFLAYL